MLSPIPKAIQGLMNPAVQAALFGELQGLSVSVIDGAAANTSMPLAGIRPNDTIIAAIRFNDAWAAPTSELGSITIQPVKASGTLTVSGNPVDGETFVVNDNVYTFKNAPSRANHVKITAGNNNAIAASMAAAINAYEGRYESQLNGDGNRKAGVVATALAAVVTVTAGSEGAGNGVPLTGTATVLAATNAGTGQATLTAATVVAGNTFVLTKLDGTTVTFTASATPTGDQQFGVKSGNPAQAVEIARAINAYEFKYGTTALKATAAGSAVNITSQNPRAGNTITLTDNATNITASGTGTLAGGTNTGAIRSTSDLSAATLVLVWFNKP